MKAIKYFVFLLLIALSWSCKNDFINEIFVTPVAKFQLTPDAATYQVLSPITFQNQGAGQTFVVFPGDVGHVYGQQNSTGFATDISGSFTYYYNEIGTYSAVWVASSIQSDGTVVSAVDSVQINVIASDGGLSNFIIPNIYKMNEYSTGPYYSSYGTFVPSNSPDTIVCPIIYEAWVTTSTINTIKRAFSVQFDLVAPATSTMSWHDPVSGNDLPVTSGSTTRNIWFVTPQTAGGANVQLQTQQFIVTTASGFKYNYYVSPVVIPNFTSFSITIGGTTYTSTYNATTIVAADNTITRDGSFYNRFNVNLTLPKGTDLSALVPDFVVVNNDANLTDGSNLNVLLNGISQTSGASVVDLSSRSVAYDIKMGLLGDPNPNLIQEALMIVNIKLQ